MSILVGDKFWLKLKIRLKSTNLSSQKLAKAKNQTKINKIQLKIRPKSTKSVYERKLQTQLNEL